MVDAVSGHRRMAMRALSATLLLVLAAAPLTGCTSTGSRSGPRAGELFGPGRITPETANAMVIGFADDHVLNIMEAVETLQAQSPSAQDRLMLNSISLKNAQATFDIASSSNPITALTDMYVMVALSQESTRRGIIARSLRESELRRPESYEVEEEVVVAQAAFEERAIYRAFTASMRDIRALAEQVFWPEQLDQLDALIDQWWLKNPNRTLVTAVRLQDFAGYRSASVQVISDGPRNILGLLYLDPFAGMDPAAREIAQSRILAERVNYQVNRLPTIVALHARGLLYETLATEELAAAGTALAGAQETLAQFVAAAGSLPDAVAAEREIALEQIAEMIQVERQATIEQIEATVARQREETLAALDERAELINSTMSQLDASLTSATALSASVAETVRTIETMDLTEFQRLVEEANESVGAWNARSDRSSD